MTPSILGRKVGMTQVYLEDGRVVPVTVIQAGPCHVLQVRSQDRDGYEAVQLGFEDKPRRLASRAERGHVASLDSKRAKVRAASGVELVEKGGCEPQRFVREFRGSSELQVGAEVTVVDLAVMAGGFDHPHHKVRGEAQFRSELTLHAKKATQLGQLRILLRLGQTLLHIRLGET